MVEIGRDFWTLSGPPPLLKQGHLEPVAQDHVQMVLNIAKDGDYTILLCSLCQCSVTLTVKKVLPQEMPSNLNDSVIL